MSEKHWEHFPHEADMGVRGMGASKEEAFEQAAIALVAVSVKPQQVAPIERVEITCEILDDELGLVDWLNAVIYEMATRKMVFGRFSVSIEGGRLRAEAWGEEIVPARHQPAVEVKGATYTALQVRKEPGNRWIAQCIVDV